MNWTDIRQSAAVLEESSSTVGEAAALAILMDEFADAWRRIAELEDELAAAEGTIRALEDPEVRAALTEPTSGDYGPVPDPREGE